MFISTIIPTIGRPSLSRAVESVLEQKCSVGGFEVIVVNDSGERLPEASWQHSERVRVISTNRHNRSVARNAGAAIARGKYLHFLDDDDWMLPGAFESFWKLTNSSQATWLYGAFRLVDNSGKTITEIYPGEIGNCFIQLIAWEWLPLQASIIDSKAFFAVGGFASLYSLLGGFEDIDLSRQIAGYYDIDRTNMVVACIRAGDQGSTTNYTDMFEQNRQSREKALSLPGAFKRIKASARSSLSRSEYWYGKITYYYLASIRWHLQRKRLFAAVSRSVYALVSFTTAGRYLLSTDFWLGVLRPHYSRMGVALQESGADHLYANSRSG
ncbi:MAG: glycosyltransferase family A protein [Anaerolineales bacterium]